MVNRIYLVSLRERMRICLTGAEHVTELEEGVLGAHFLIEQGHLHDREAIVQQVDLVEVLLLHLGTCAALTALGALVREEHLVDDDVAHVDAVRAQLLHETLSLEKGQEFRDADAHEGGELGVLEVLLDSADVDLHLLKLLEDVLVVTATHHRGHALHHAAELVLDGVELGEGLLEHGGEGEETEGVASGGGVEDDARVREILHLLHQLSETHSFIDTGDRRDDIIEETLLIRQALEGLALVEVGLDLHRVQVVKTGNKGRARGELLSESIRNVVRGISRDQENLFTILGELSSNRTRGSGLTDTTLTTDENPTMVTL